MYQRCVEKRLQQALSDTRVVLVAGPRQAGKTTLVKRFSQAPFTYVSLDNLPTLHAAQADPLGFIEGKTPMVIDEIQRAPDLLLAIKEHVDNHADFGQFLITGSADLLNLPRVADSLAGRLEVINLLPLAQCEINQQASHFLDKVFDGPLPRSCTPLSDAACTQMVLAGGYPEALTRTSSVRRQAWYQNYIKTLVARDVRDIAQIEHLPRMPKFLRALAQSTGQMLSPTNLGAPLEINHTTARKYLEVFSHMFLVAILQPWYQNSMKRLVKTPKVHFYDAGLVAAMQNTTQQHVHKKRALLGPLLETFVFAELKKLASWHSVPLEFYHFRLKEQHEVDIVLEDAAARVVGIEIKAAATVGLNDFKGMQHLAQACGTNFVRGVVLYRGGNTLRFGKNMYALPLAALWES